MSTTYKARAWDAMTHEQKVEWLATKVMGWRRGKPDEHGYLFEDEDAWYEPDEDEPSYSADGCDRTDGMTAWRPMTDWNHWRQVEEKVMEDDDVFAHHMAKVIVLQWQKENGNTISISSRRGGVTFRRTLSLMRADLPTRCKALYLAVNGN